MKRYVLLSMDIDAAQDFIEDMRIHPDYPLLTPVREKAVAARLVSSWPAMQVPPVLDEIALDWAAVCASKKSADRQDPSGLIPPRVRNAFDRSYWMSIASEVLRAYIEARAGLNVRS